MPGDRVEYALAWYQRARNDLKVARGEMATAYPATEAVCFHLQQAIEKMLKAWLVVRGREFPPTHNLAALIRLCERLEPAFASIREAEILTVYAVEGRYPDAASVPTPEEMQAAAGVALPAFDFIARQLRAQRVVLPPAPWEQP